MRNKVLFIPLLLSVLLGQWSQQDCSLRDKDNYVLTYNSLVNGLVDVK